MIALLGAVLLLALLAHEGRSRSRVHAGQSVDTAPNPSGSRVLDRLWGAGDSSPRDAFPARSEDTASSPAVDPGPRVAETRADERDLLGRSSTSETVVPQTLPTAFSAAGDPGTDPRPPAQPAVEQ